MFEHSRRFLQRLERSLGNGSSLYQQVVSVLQGSSAPLPEHMKKVDNDISPSLKIMKKYVIMLLILNYMMSSHLII